MVRKNRRIDRAGQGLLSDFSHREMASDFIQRVDGITPEKRA